MPGTDRDDEARALHLNIARAMRNRARNSLRFVSPVLALLVRARELILPSCLTNAFYAVAMHFVQPLVFYPRFMDGFCVLVDCFVSVHCLCVTRGDALG